MKFQWHGNEIAMKLWCTCNDHVRKYHGMQWNAMECEKQALHGLASSENERYMASICMKMQCSCNEVAMQLQWSCNTLNEDVMKLDWNVMTCTDMQWHVVTCEKGCRSCFGDSQKKGDLTWPALQWNEMWRQPCHGLAKGQTQNGAPYIAGLVIQYDMKRESKALYCLWPDKKRLRSSAC